MSRRQGPRHARRRPVVSFFWPVVVGSAVLVVLVGFGLIYAWR